MNYVKSLNLLGVEAQQIPCIEINGAPTENTEGAVGLLCMDITSENKDIYKCVGAENGVYTWKKDSVDIVQTTGDSETAVMSQKTVTESDKLQGIVNTKNVVFSRIENYRIVGGNGVIEEAINYYYTDLIPLAKGERLYVEAQMPSIKANGVVSIWSDETTFVRSLLICQTTEVMACDYTAEEDCYIRLCGFIGYKMEVKISTFNESNYSFAEKKIKSTVLSVPSMITGTYLKGDGKTGTHAETSITDFVELVPCASLTFKNIRLDDSRAICVYNDNKELICSLYTEHSTQTKVTVTPTPEWAYIRCNAKTGVIPTIIASMPSISDVYIAVQGNTSSIEALEDNVENLGIDNIIADGFESGKYVYATNGTVMTTNETSSITDYIPVDSFSKVEIEKVFLEGNRSVCGYDKNKQFVVCFASGTTDTSVTINLVPYNVAYIRLTHKTGTHPVIKRNNAVSKENVFLTNNISIDVNGFESGYLSLDGVTKVESEYYVCSPYIPVDAHRKIKLQNFTNPLQNAFYCYDENKNFVCVVQTEQVHGSYISIGIYTIPYGVSFIRAHTRVSNISNFDIIYTEQAYRHDDVAELVNGWYAGSHHRAETLFKTATTKPVITFIDDDTSNLAGIKLFHDALMGLGVRGTYACLPYHLDQDTTKELANTLLEYEREGFHITLHSYTQNPLYQTIHPQRFSKETWSDEDVENWKAVENDFVKGIQKMKEYGFVDYRFWVTPYGVYGGVFDELARKWGMNCALSNSNFGYEGTNPTRGRYGLWRQSIGSDDIDNAGSHTIADIKSTIDEASAEKGWVIVTTHMTYKTTDGQLKWDEDSASTRIGELVNYAKSKGFEVKTLNEAWRIREPIYRFYEMF